MTYEISTEDGDLKEGIVTILEEAFERFDLDKDGALNSKELEAFAVALNGEVVSHLPSTLKQLSVR